MSFSSLQTEGEVLRDMLKDADLAKSRFIKVYYKLSTVLGDLFGTIKTIGWCLIATGFVIAIVGFSLSFNEESARQNKAWVLKILVGVVIISALQTILLFGFNIGASVGE